MERLGKLSRKSQEVSGCYYLRECISQDGGRFCYNNKWPTKCSWSAKYVFLFSKYSDVGQAAHQTPPGSRINAALTF